MNLMKIKKLVHPDLLRPAECHLPWAAGNKRLSLRHILIHLMEWQTVPNLWNMERQMKRTCYPNKFWLMVLDNCNLQQMLVISYHSLSWWYNVKSMGLLTILLNSYCYVMFNHSIHPTPAMMEQFCRCQQWRQHKPQTVMQPGSCVYCLHCCQSHAQTRTTQMPEQGITRPLQVLSMWWPPAQMLLLMLPETNTSISVRKQSKFKIIYTVNL